VTEAACAASAARARAAARCGFASLETAIGAVIRVHAVGVPIGRIEFLDGQAGRSLQPLLEARAARAADAVSRVPRAPAAVAEQVETVQALCAEFGGSGYAWAHHARKSGPFVAGAARCLGTALALRPGCQGIPPNVCVPISRLAEAPPAAAAATSTSSASGAECAATSATATSTCASVVDAGDGARWPRANERPRLVTRADEMGGTCTGEHGMATAKIDCRARTPAHRCVRWRRETRARPQQPS